MTHSRAMNLNTKLGCVIFHTRLVYPTTTDTVPKLKETNMYIQSIIDINLGSEQGNSNFRPIQHSSDQKTFATPALSRPMSFSVQAIQMRSVLRTTSILLVEITVHPVSIDKIGPNRDLHNEMLYISGRGRRSRRGRGGRCRRAAW